MNLIRTSDRGISLQSKRHTLVISDDGITLHEQGGRIVRFPFDAVDALYDISSGSDVYASDFQFTVLVLSQNALVIPVEFGTLLALLPAPLLIRLEQQPLISAYSIVAPPRHWRTWRWNPFAPPSVRLILDDRASLMRYREDWLLRRGLRTLAQYTDPAIIKADEENYRRRFWKGAFDNQGDA